MTSKLFCMSIYTYIYIQYTLTAAPRNYYKQFTYRGIHGTAATYCNDNNIRHFFGDKS